MKLFVDGVVAYAKPTANKSLCAGNAVWIGRRSNGFFWNGQVDEDRFWNVARTDADVAANISTGLRGNEGG